MCVLRDTGAGLSYFNSLVKRCILHIIHTTTGSYQHDKPTCSQNAVPPDEISSTTQLRRPKPNNEPLSYTLKLPFLNVPEANTASSHHLQVYKKKKKKKKQDMHN